MERHTLRTINVITDVPGIAEEIQVNVAYRHAEGLTYLQAKEFEYALQMRIQATLDEFRKSPTPSLPPTSDRFVPLDTVLQITGHATPKAFEQWRSRHHARYANSRIIYRSGKYELRSILRAVAIERGEVAA